MKRRLVAPCVGAFGMAIALLPSYARADDTPPAAPSAPAAGEDEWTQKIRQGMKSEGVKTQAEVEREETAKDAFVANRTRLRFFVHGAIGGGTFEPGDVSSSANIDGGGGPIVGIGGGLRVGLSPLWQFQARVSVEWSPTSSDCWSYANETTYSCSSATVILPSVDGTFRLAFGQTSPFFVGLGPKIGLMRASATGTLSNGSNGSSPPPPGTTSIGGSSLFLGAVLEIGALFGPSESIELALRPYVGTTLSDNGGSDGGVVLAGAYAF